MSAEGDLARMERVSAVVAAANGDDPAHDLSRACAHGLAVSGAGVMVMNSGVSVPLSSSDPTAAAIEDLQNTLGEGPCIDAHTTGRPVSEPDLATPRQGRWMAFGPAALDAGAGAVFAFPLRVGGVRLGALTLHRSQAGGMSDEQHLDAQAMANVVAHAILAMQAEAAPGSLGPDLEALASYGAEVHQASGMVSVQLGVSVGEALARLRAHAYGGERLLSHVAADVVSRRLRFDE